MARRRAVCCSFFLTDTRARAEQAKRELEEGERWNAIRHRYAADRELGAAAANPGSIKAGAVDGELEEPLNSRIFAVREHVVTGPVPIRSGWYVFEVLRISPGPLRDA